MISVVINAKNEQEMIKGCLESVKWADELVIILNDSTDKTEEITKKYTDKIYKISGQDFAKVKNLGFQKTTGDWVLFIDADERVLDTLKEEILKLVSQGDYSVEQNDENSAYALSRRNIIFGQEVNYGPYQHDWIIRLVKKSACNGWVGKVHEHLEFNGNLGYTKNSLLHLTHRNLDQFIQKSLEWSQIDAKLRLEAGHPKMTGIRFLRIFITETFNQGIKRKGFFNGTIGMIDSLLQVFSMFMTYVRLWELQHSKSLDQVYEEIDKKLMENGFKY